MNIRSVTEDDIDWIYAAGSRYYKDINEDDTKMKFRSILKNPDAFFIRSDTAVFAGIIGHNAYNSKERVVEDCFFFGKGVVDLIRAAMMWGKANGATDLHIGLSSLSKLK